MDEMLAAAKKEVLVEMVKLAQKRGMSGSKGNWKEFLAVHDKKLGKSLSDPSRRQVESLVEFLNTFSQDDDMKFFEKVLQCHSNRNEVEQLKKASPDAETAEQRLVRLTLEHPLYPIDYSFPSHEEDWLVSKKTKKIKAGISVAIIAIDCEMVLCEDGTEALVKVCAVDRDLKVKLDAIVNPNKKIADYRTQITGISAKDLDGVTHSLKDVQKSMRKLLSHGTILVGHSLKNDLQALKIDHARVIDTSYIFKYGNAPANRRPSLSLLCKVMLGYDLRKDGDPHNCLDDACAAMNLVLARLEGKIDDVIPGGVAEMDTARMLVHRIPLNVPSNDLHRVLSGDFTIDVKVSKKRSTTYSAFAVYKNQNEADEAFEKLEGDLGKDSRGRPQKVVNFDLGSGLTGTLCVCKNVSDDLAGQLESRKRVVEDDSSGMLKKLRTDQPCDELNDSDRCSNHCEAHMKEIERLKQELSQRDQEISSLNKIIAALARKQGL